MTTKPTVGVIGLGIMGGAMAKNIAKKGYTVFCTTRTEEKRNEFKAAGLSVLETPKHVAEKADVIIVIVTDPTAVKKVLSGSDGVFEAKVQGKTLIQMSTIDIPTTLWTYKECTEIGLNFIDCPVTGSKKQVDEAQLILLAGGEQKLIQSVREILLSMGKAVIEAGDVGKGTALKLCMNLIVSQMTTALCESVALAKVLELQPDKIFDVIAESPALNCGYFKIKKENLLNETFDAAFSLDNMLKDVRFMETAAKSARLALPVTQAVRFLMEGAVHEGLGSQDLTSIAKILKVKSRE